jgi:hypothetical protein
VVSVSPALAPALGLAVDIGTTKLAGYLLDLKNGVTLAITDGEPPDCFWGRRHGAHQPRQ